MHPLSQAVALLAACAVGGVHAASPTSGVLQVDLAFPGNQTYAPTSRLPIVFAYQNPELATALRVYVSVNIWNWDDMGKSPGSATLELGQSNLSSRDPFLRYEYFPWFEAEGQFLLTWSVGWANCTEESLGQTYTGTRIANRVETHSILFTINNSAPAIDLVAATDNKDCPQELGFAIDVKDTLELPPWVDKSNGDHCAVVAESMPTPSPCRVQIDSAAASSMAASMTARACKYTPVIPPPKGVECPVEDESSAQQLVVTGLACLAATVGAIGFVLMG